MPVFLVISGYLFLNPCREMGLGRMLTKYCRRIVLALILFGVPYGCLELLAAEGRFRPGMPGEAFVKVLRGQSWSHMWYLYLILLLYAVTPLLKRVLKAVPRWAVGAAALVLLILRFDAVWGGMQVVFSTLTPVLGGLIVAYVLNVFVHLFEDIIFKPFQNSPSPTWQKLRRPLYRLRFKAAGAWEGAQAAQHSFVVQ